MTVQELIAVLEAATGPAFVLDHEIALWNHNDLRAAHEPLAGIIMNPKPYTASIDAALTLVPEGWASASIHDRRGPIGYVHNNEMAFVGIAGRPNPAKVWHEVRHPVRAIALCIAALKARAA